jgi:hypothetical protein
MLKLESSANYTQYFTVFANSTTACRLYWQLINTPQPIMNLLIKDWAHSNKINVFDNIQIGLQIVRWDFKYRKKSCKYVKYLVSRCTFGRNRVLGQGQFRKNKCPFLLLQRPTPFHSTAPHVRSQPPHGIC